MGNKQLRIGQLIAPFGPGSIYTDRRGVPHVVCGLDHWFKQSDKCLVLLPCDKPLEFHRFEPRLAALLNISHFRRPPDFRTTRRGRPAPPNAHLYIPALRFPRWYRHSKTGQMRRFNLNTQVVDRPTGGGRWLPVRFVAVCSAGHLCEFPWKQWIGCQCPDGGSLHLTDRGGSELSSIRVECHSCPKGSPGSQGKSLAGTLTRPDPGIQSAFQKAGIACTGDRPWLGEDATELGCAQPLVGALINQTNLYFPKTVSAIALPDFQLRESPLATLRAEIEQDPAPLAVALTIWRSGGADERSDLAADMKRKLARRGIKAEEPEILQALKSLFETAPSALPPDAAVPSNPESDLLAFRRAEFNAIRNQVHDPVHVPNLRVILSTVPPGLANWIARVNLVERLRETRVFYGFDRLEQGGASLAGMPDVAMRQLFLSPPDPPQERWLPAIDVFGEGIFVEFSEERIKQWQNDHDAWLLRRLSDAFIARLSAVFQSLPPTGPADRTWASKYVLVHTLAHILINQLVFECGYSTASLRERLYISADQAAPMAGVLIYTAAGDSEGTLGGLVRLGRPERLGPLFSRALSRASWCSADPVCSEHMGGQGPRLVNLAACHACVLLPETSCETVNQGLDRAMVVGTPRARQHGFMSSMLEAQYQLG